MAVLTNEQIEQKKQKLSEILQQMAIVCPALLQKHVDDF